MDGRGPTSGSIPTGIYETIFYLNAILYSPDEVLLSKLVILMLLVALIVLIRSWFGWSSPRFGDILFLNFFRTVWTLKKWSPTVFITKLVHKNDQPSRLPSVTVTAGLPITFHSAANRKYTKGLTFRCLHRRKINDVTMQIHGKRAILPPNFAANLWNMLAT